MAENQGFQPFSKKIFSLFSILAHFLLLYRAERKIKRNSPKQEKKNRVFGKEKSSFIRKALKIKENKMFSDTRFGRKSEKFCKMQADFTLILKKKGAKRVLSHKKYRCLFKKNLCLQIETMSLKKELCFQKENTVSKKRIMFLKRDSSLQKKNPVPKERIPIE